jgi:UDP-N-acetylenolpyruvoylglucosamine reductase
MFYLFLHEALNQGGKFTMSSDVNISLKESILKDAVEIAKKGTHCGMCRFDFLGSGVCPAGRRKGFLAYWPQGRMEIVKHLDSGKVKPTEILKDIVSSCNLCGICDKQCNFITQLRPEKVAKTLKEYVENLDESEFQSFPDNEINQGLREIVGEEWATNDPVIISSYTMTILPKENELNYYVVMPENTEQVSKIIKFANKNNIPYAPRSGGTAFMAAAPTILAKGLSLEKGIIIDLYRLRNLKIHSESQTATVGAGITMFELQKEALSYKLRALAAEAGAHVCSNILTTGIISTWGNKYGAMADNFIDLTTIDDEGNIKKHSDWERNNPYSTEPGFTNLSLTPSVIVTEAVVKLHPIWDDEEAVLVPFDNIRDAYRLLIKLGKRDVGLSLAVLSRKYLAEFLSPTLQISKDFNYVCKNYLKLNYVVAIICNQDDKIIIENMVDYTIDKSLMRSLILGAPRFTELKDSEFMKILSEEEDPLKAIFAGPMRKHLEKALDPSPENVARVFDEDFQDFFISIYNKPEMTDIVWLHAFRILPTRMMRQQMFMGPGAAMWTGDEDHYINWIKMFDEIGEKYNLEHSLGFISPLDHGKFAYMEYDYYYDHNNPDECERISKSLIESMKETLVMGKGLTILNYLFKGMHRKEHVLYPISEGISEEEQELFDELIDTILGD